MSLEIIQKDICVVISAYCNDEAISLRDAIYSLLNQTLIPAKIILVVDGPIHRELKAIADFFVNDKLIEVIYLKQNMGLGLARNKAIKNLKYKYLAFMDADDISRPDRFLILASRILELNILDKDENNVVTAVADYSTFLNDVRCFVQEEVMTEKKINYNEN